MLFALLIMFLSSFEQINPPITPSNAAQVEEINRFQISGGAANAIAFNPANSSQLAVAQANGYVSIWDVTTGDLLSSWKVAEGEVYALAYLNDWRRLVTVGEDGDVKIWDAGTYDLLQSLLIEGEIPVLLDVSENNVLAVAYRSGRVRLWNIDTGENILTFFGYNREANGLDFSPNDSRLAFGYSFGEIFIYRLQNIDRQEVYLEETLEAGELTDLAFYPVLLESWMPKFANALMTIGAFNSGNLALPLSGYNTSYSGFVDTESTMAYPRALSFSHDGRLLIVAGKLTAAGGGCNTNPCPIEISYMPNNFWRWEDNEQIGKILISLEGNKVWYTDVAFSGDDRFIASSSMDGLVVIWGIPISE